MIAPVPKTLSDLLHKAYVRDHDLAPLSVEQLDVTVESFSRWYADADAAPAACDPIASLSEGLLTAFLHWLREHEKLGPTTANNRRTHLLTLWRYACEQGYHARLPQPKKIVRFRVPRRLPDAWTQDELAKLLTACAAYAPVKKIPGWDGRHWRAVALVLYDTAYRCSACLALEKHNLRCDGAILAEAETQKTFSDEAQWLAGDTMRAVARMPAHDSTRVFPWPFQKKAFRDHWKKILRAAGLRATRRDGPQKMRRTSASWVKARGGNATQHLGHKTAGLAERNYIDPRIASPQRASNLLPRIGGAQLELF